MRLEKGLVNGNLQILKTTQDLSIQLPDDPDIAICFLEEITGKQFNSINLVGASNTIHNGESYLRLEKKFLEC